MNLRWSLLLGTVAFATLASAVAAYVPSPFGFYLALAGVLWGPGFGCVLVLFPRGTLSAIESVFIGIMASIGIAVATLFTLNMVNVRLDRAAIATTVVALTLITSAAAAAVESRRQADCPALLKDSYPRVAWRHLLSFAVGVLSVVFLAGIVSFFAG